MESCNINYKIHVELSDTESRMHVKKRSGNQENKALELVHSTVITLCFRTLKLIISEKNRGVRKQRVSEKHVFVHLEKLF